MNQFAFFTESVNWSALRAQYAPGADRSPLAADVDTQFRQVRVTFYFWFLIARSAVVAACACQILEGQSAFLSAITTGQSFSVGQLRHVVASCNADAVLGAVRAKLAEVELALHGTDSREKWDANPHLDAAAPILVL